MFSNNLIAGAAGQSTDFYPVSIDQSLRFNSADNAYLRRTPSSTGNQRTWTWSGWVKRSTLGTGQMLFESRPPIADNDRTFIILGSSDAISVTDISGGGHVWRLDTEAKFRDVSAWYHIVVKFDTTQSTASDRVKIYINGVLFDDFDSGVAGAGYPSQNYQADINAQHPHTLGDSATAYSANFGGYLAEVHFTDGTAYDADAFGELKSGVWVAKTPSVTYGTNGFYLDFANSADIGNDVSGEGNDWTPNNFTASDVVLDSPTDNFATLNPLDKGIGTLSDGNLQISTTEAETGGLRATIGQSSGKYYFEMTTVSFTGPNWAGFTGLAQSNATITNWIAGGNYVVYETDGSKRIDGTLSSYGTGYSGSVGNVIGVAVDFDANEVEFFLNNVSQGVISGALEAGKEYFPVYYDGSTIRSQVARFDFGQLGFEYTPPTGYLALSTANLPEPTISPADDASPEDYFNTVLYTGDGNDDRSITGVGFQPDFVWFKQRNATRSHLLVDAIRGATQRLKSDTTDAEDTFADGCQAFEADGFEIGTNNTVNVSGGSYVAWNWKANGSGVSNTDGSITSTVSANTESGFSIITYTGNGSSGQSVGHGLDAKPELVFKKNRSQSTNWAVTTTLIDGSNDYAHLNLTQAFGNSAEGAPTSSVIPVYPNAENNSSGDDFICYAFHSVEGFSKFGSYTGNGSTDGPFVYTGFRPAFVMVKRTDSTNSWSIWDSVREPENFVGARIYANQSGAEINAGLELLDFTSNGFKLRLDAGSFNASGGTFIFMAFSDANGPFKYSNAR